MYVRSLKRYEICLQASGNCTQGTRVYTSLNLKTCSHDSAEKIIKLFKKNIKQKHKMSGIFH